MVILLKQKPLMICNLKGSFVILLLTSFLAQCTSPAPKATNQQTDTVSTLQGNNSEEISETKNEDYQTAFVVVLDTSDQFQKMYDLAMSTSRKFNVPFDTVQKSYFPETNIWGVSQSSDDEIYRGEYFPRRNGSEKDMLSLEYQYWYDKKGNDKNLMLVTNIFSFSMDAEQSVAAWRKHFPQAFILQCEMYMGCMH